MRRRSGTAVRAGLLAILLSAVARGQWEEPEMYEYQELFRSGDVMFAWAETGLASPMLPSCGQ